LSPDQRHAAARAMAAYGGMAEAADHEIGRLIDHLKATGAYDNTIFVFLSDNGPEPTDPRGRLLNRLVLGLLRDFAPDHQGERGTLTAIGPSWASAAAAPLAGYKFSAGEGGLRVPLIVSWPGNPAMRSGTIVGGF
ncbi:sulfatase-like hydrolase/transferase, partial [Escherichia coli]|uniref:sulfatase-like hydrolase/transferase n=3 Tax=Pseudomonadota TaxID=1224 RepID=UPI000FAAA662